ncbi:SLD2 (YKL108W) [Zygosaccharomyces parabailii]|uniref:DNA replication regulator SLD2 n=1 Tax=Zygosaccharomyces bailii (strain CLIB 213 / ATCC 58445 / CBS 680 / BCRC 21525 / NBRC 1098 / NCYC 1416 / NRRL Y-2227) TaxID=1333698 RepID=A0A8J2X7C7_ZYGB2|nr:SLD2 (YKL108W) [Zygosaccharomyces parabailii]CDF89023.1 ZYBA0S03-07404g1_1 [Zygosaccharomyces bailii CLIB 213]CDH16107.1 uncharacterized protein ZBAI_07895 [Zygosaccharomyces bailii ISA1307]
MNLEQLKVGLKTWEHDFEAKHHRAPTKDDIRRLPDIKQMYKQYQAIKKQEAKISKVVATPSKEVYSPKKSRTTVDADRSSGIELGPTPQIYGKAISIFELKLSPVKRSLTFEEQDQSFVASAASTDLEESDSEDIKRRLEFPVTTPNSSPFKRLKPAVHKYYGPNSPMKLEEENIKLTITRGSPLRRTPQKNSNLANENVSFSPSPLVRRPLTKSLLELAREHEAILEEFENLDEKERIFSQEADQSSSDAQNDENSTETANVKKPKRRRILRRLVPAEETKLVPRDISKELLRLKKQQVQHFLGKETTEQTEEDENSPPEVSKTKGRDVPPPGKSVQAKKRKSKYNLVSNNFKRLRLPRKNSGNRRWQRRR